MKILCKLTVPLIFLAILFGKETQLTAQPDFSNRIITTDQYPVAKKRIDSIMNNAPYIFEGRMIKYSPKPFYYSYLFEIEKVYRGGDRLQAGTVEIIAKMPENSSEPPLVGFSYSRHIIFAKETDMPNSFDANNLVSLEVFYHNMFDITSCFKEMPTENHYTSGLSLNFRTKEEVSNFLAAYKLFPVDVSKADTVKTLRRVNVN